MDCAIIEPKFIAIFRVFMQPTNFFSLLQACTHEVSSMLVICLLLYMVLLLEVMHVQCITAESSYIWQYLHSLIICQLLCMVSASIIIYSEPVEA